ncbi:pVII [red squirrel adenovirus 1]|uniref:PVII n=1 Tax=red squirrel adenovirus 1 TaxID=2773314 RepID=A0A220A474_9ADEN|nr:pVII [red squirrel adenovirus 1]ARE31885.1 pVII [red squirrel adenovirus 1]WUG45426.1 pVII [Squirrel mastadenovirus A]
MAVLISPSNNSGWGLGMKSMYGGAKSWTESHPVMVRKHFRARWGSKSGRKVVTTTTVDDAIEAVVRRARRGKRRRGRGRRIPSASTSFLSRALQRIQRRRRARTRRTRRL